jgi:hypothetical protein
VPRETIYAKLIPVWDSDYQNIVEVCKYGSGSMYERKMIPKIYQRRKKTIYWKVWVYISINPFTPEKIKR